MFFPFLSFCLISFPLSLFPSFPFSHLFHLGVCGGGRRRWGIKDNKITCQRISTEMQKVKTAKFKSSETSTGICPALVFKQLDFVCMYVCAQSVSDSFNVLGSPTPNQIGVQSNRKVHRGLSLMHCNRLLSFC